MDAPGSRKWILVAIGALLFLAAASSLRSCFLGWKAGRNAAAGEGAAAETGLSLPALLGEDSSGPAGGGFRKVEGPRPFRFPEDHGSHPEFRSEWWYFTGNLQDTLGRAFGYQLTVFRSGLRPSAGAGPAGADSIGRAPGGRSSPWAAGEAYMAHFALTDAAGGTFEAHERFSRGALGLAGAEGGPRKPFRIWLEDWSMVSEAPAPVDRGSADNPETIFPLRLRAAQGGIAIDLRLEAGKPLVLQGDRGYSRKGPGAGNASHYYSFTRMPSSGQVTSPAGTFRVTGSSWWDREWGSSLLTPGLAGWEWFGLRLADSTEWTFFRLRKAGPAAAAEDSVAFDYGLKVDSRGVTGLLGPGDLSARILSRWNGSGAAYPARWRIRVLSASLEMDVTPILAGQELALSIPYWEGAVRVEARRDGKPLSGDGYMELTGYR